MILDSKLEKVFTEIVPNCKAKTLQSVIRVRINIKSVIHSDGWKGYNGLVDVGYSKHFRVHHSADEFARRIGTINYEVTCAISNRVPRVYK